LQKIDAYIKVNNTYISMEKALDDNQIIETILAEQLKYDQDDLNSSDEKLPKISPAKGLNRLKTFILFAKQIDNNFSSIIII
ncbi:11427_t:CDS:1, partial [Racocetra fulgida]